MHSPATVLRLIGRRQHLGEHRIDGATLGVVSHTSVGDALASDLPAKAEPFSRWTGSAPTVRPPDDQPSRANGAASVVYGVEYLCPGQAVLSGNSYWT